MDSTSGDGIGHRVQRARRYHGMSLDVLAGRTGKSKSWLSMVENGQRTLDRRTDIALLADALGVDAADLVGHAVPVFSKGVPDLARMRDALMENAIGDPAGPASVPLARIAATAMPALRGNWRDGSYQDQADALGPLLADLHAHASAGRKRSQALALLTEAAVYAKDLAKEIGDADLAWIAAERATQAAAAHGGAVTRGMAAWALAVARPTAARSRALLAAGAHADAIERDIEREDRPLGWQVYGMLRLTAALAAHLTGDRDQSAAQHAEASRVATRIGEQPGRWEAFGPANAALWRVSLLNEAGDSGAALEASEEVCPADLISAARRSALRLERGRALAMLGGHREDAVRELHAAEQASPLRFRCDPMAREIVGTMLEQSRRQERARTRDLRGLAWRMGVIGEA
jgi:transcriptional regulator with XRE-family HTH domain